MNEVLQQLIDFLKTASPAIWAALTKQVYITAAQQLAWAAILAIVGLGCCKIAAHAYSRIRADEYSDWTTGEIFSAVGALASFLIAFGLCIGAVGRFINPEFYAIQYIVMGFK